MAGDETVEGRRGVVVSGRFAELEDALVERVLELRRDRPLAPLVVVVGSGAVRTRIDDLLVRRLGAVANVSVVTLARLAADVVARHRGAPPAVAVGLVRERLVHGVVQAASRTGLRYLGRAADRPHFAAALAATFADLREACVDPESGWERYAAEPGSTGGRAKGDDLGALYATYCHRLDELALLDRAGVYLAAATALGVVAETVLYGMYDLNEAQERFVAALLARGADLFVPLAGNGDETLATTLAAARRARLDERPMATPDIGADRRRASLLAGSLAHDVTPADRLVGDGSLCVVSVADERAEAREAVRAVLRAARDGAALWDCAVVVPHADETERLSAALLESGLRVAARRPDRCAGSRLVTRLLDALAPPAGEPLARRAVVELLRAAPVQATLPPPRTAAFWLDEARRAGVVGGAEQWRDRMKRRTAYLERLIGELRDHGEDPAVSGEDDVAALDEATVRLAASRSLAAAVGSLIEACEALPDRGRWSAWTGALTAVIARVFEDPTAREAADLIALLDGLDVLGDEVALTEVAAALREHLAGVAVQTGRVGRDGVAVLTPLELRGLRFHTVAFCGLAEGGFPLRGRPDPILGDAARRRLNEALHVRLPLAETRDAEARLLFDFVCEAARERLVLIVPRTEGATGRPRLPSRILLSMASAQAGRPVGLDDFMAGLPLAVVWRHASGLRPPVGDEATWVDARERDVAVLSSLGAACAGGTGRAYLDTVLGDEAEAERRLGAWEAGRSPVPGARDGLLSGDARAALAAPRLFAAETHPTRVERYIACPFAFLLRDVLGLDAPDEPGATLDIEAREFGTLVHDILERTFTAVIADDLSLDGALAALERAWGAGCAVAERRGVTGAALAWEVRRRLLLDDLGETVRRDPVFKAGEGRPLAVEWRFGERHGRPVEIPVAAGFTVRFAGRLDRVDEVPDGVRIVDYKTGGGGAEKARLKAGLSVQLPVYQSALRQTEGRDCLDIVCGYRFVTRKGEFAELTLEIDERAAAARLRDVVARVAELVDEGVFARSTAGRCQSCDIGYACGLTEWAKARKRRHPALEALVGLQSGAVGEVSVDGGS